MGLPLIGIGVNGGIGPLRVALTSNPSAAILESAASIPSPPFFSLHGLITAPCDDQASRVACSSFADLDRQSLAVLNHL